MGEFKRLLLSCAPLLASALRGVAAATQGRESARNLEQENWDKVDWIDDETYTNSGTTIFSNWTKHAQNMGDRVDEDLATMWETAPSQWIAEYWEVLAVFLGLVFIIALCYCMLCCSCCCGGDPASRRVMDTDEYKSYQQQSKDRYTSQEPTSMFVAMNDNSPKQDQPTTQTTPSKAEEIQKIEKSASLTRTTTGATGASQSLLSDNETTQDGTKTASTSKRGSSMLMEVVDVWSEFLVHQFDRVGRSSPHRRKREADYRREPSSRRETIRRSRQSPRNSRRSHKSSSPRVMRNESTDSLDIV